MTDVRDPDPQTEQRTRTVETPMRQTFVSRALAPIRRGKGQEVEAKRSQDVALPTSDPFIPAVKRKFPIVRLSLFLVVLLPILVGGLYLFGFASDQYVAETRFAVRQADPLPYGNNMEGLGLGSSGGSDAGSKGGSASSGSLGGGGAASSVLSGGGDLAGPEAAIVADYIHSRAVVDDVSKLIDVRAIFQRPEADFWARFPQDASQDALSKYWNRMVSVYVETSSGIVTVSASAFRREDALALTNAIVKASEQLVNTMSLRIRNDATKTAEDEVRRSETEVRETLATLTSFRNSQRLIDPVKSSEAAGTLLQGLMVDKIDTEAQIYVAEKTQGQSAPGMKSLRAKLQSINMHVEELKNQMAGDKDATKNLAATLASFEELELKKEFAQKMYGFARDGVERARIAAIRQAIYLAVFVPPFLPQDYTYPNRFADLGMIAMGFLMLWICGATVTASVLDHRL